MVKHAILLKPSKKNPAVLMLALKENIHLGLLVEMEVWSIPKSERYTHGVRYRMVLVDPHSGSVKILFDNHWPKGPHIHVEGLESTYIFSTMEETMIDFQSRARNWKQG